MEKQIEKVEIVLENCQIITVEGKHIGDFNCYDIKHSINRTACNSIDEMYTCESFSMSINRESAIKVFPDVNAFTRIMKYPDITSIYIYFTNKKDAKQIYMKWNGDICTNEYQKSYINQFGDLFIVIDEKLEISDVYDENDINKSEYMDFVWSMYE